MEVLDDVVGERFGFGEIVEVGEGFVLDPEDIEARLVTLQDFIDAELTPTSVGILRRIRFLPLVAVDRIVARNKIPQVGVAHRILLQGEMDVGAEVVYPDLLHLPLRACRLLVEEDDICLYARLVENACRQTENGMQIGCLQELLAHRLARTALEKNIVGHNDSSLACRLQDRVDVLNEVKLLV